MATLVKYLPGVNEEAIVELCEALEAAYDQAEAHRLAHTGRRKGLAEWSEMEETRRAKLPKDGAL